MHLQTAPPPAAPRRVERGPGHAAQASTDLSFIELQFHGALATGTRRDLPPFLGATLRGAFGYALKALVCQVAHGQCHRCLLRAACPYAGVFEGLGASDRQIMRRYPQVPQPFVLLLPGPGEEDPDGRELRWGLRLFGSARRYWPYAVYALQTACDRGLGRQRRRVQLHTVCDAATGSTVWSDSGADDGGATEPMAQAIDAASLTAEPEAPVTLRWCFHTPLRIRRDGQLNPRALSGLDLLQAARRRYTTMLHCYGEGEARDVDDGRWLERDEFEAVARRVRPWGFDRWSGRQQRRMRLDGLCGELTIRAPWARAAAAIAAAPVLHLGKATSFGFGRVSWQRVDTQETDER